MYNKYIAFQIVSFQNVFTQNFCRMQKWKKHDNSYQKKNCLKKKCNKRENYIILEKPGHPRLRSLNVFLRHGEALRKIALYMNSRGNNSSSPNGTPSLPFHPPPYRSTLPSLSIPIQVELLVVLLQCFSACRYFSVSHAVLCHLSPVNIRTYCQRYCGLRRIFSSAFTSRTVRRWEKERNATGEKKRGNEEGHKGKEQAARPREGVPSFPSAYR